MFNANQIKTKQQLTDIWNKSQELKQRSNELFQREVNEEVMFKALVIDKETKNPTIIKNMAKNKNTVYERP